MASRAPGQRIARKTLKDVYRGLVGVQERLQGNDKGLLEGILTGEDCMADHVKGEG